MSASINYPGGLSQLLADEAAADAQYNLPAGTLEALGATESSQGSNVGTIGNIFQVTNATTQSNITGLHPDGNNPYSVGAYIAALMAKLGGNLSAAFAAFHGGPGNPTPYAATSPAGQFLTSLGDQQVGQNYWGQPLTATGTSPGGNTLTNFSIGNPGPAGMASTGQTGGQAAGTGGLAGLTSSAAGSWFSSLESGLASIGIQILLVIFGIVLIVVGLWAFAERTSRG